MDPGSRSVETLLIKLVIGRLSPRAGDDHLLAGGISYPSSYAADSFTRRRIAVTLATCRPQRTRPDPQPVRPHCSNIGRRRIRHTARQLAERRDRRVGLTTRPTARPSPTPHHPRRHWPTRAETERAMRAARGRAGGRTRSFQGEHIDRPGRTPTRHHRRQRTRSTTNSRSFTLRRCAVIRCQQIAAGGNSLTGAHCCCVGAD